MTKYAYPCVGGLGLRGEQVTSTCDYLCDYLCDKPADYVNKFGDTACRTHKERVEATWPNENLEWEPVTPQA